jgi:hypothetical protein
VGVAVAIREAVQKPRAALCADCPMKCAAPMAGPGAAAAALVAGLCAITDAATTTTTKASLDHPPHDLESRAALEPSKYPADINIPHE